MCVYVYLAKVRERENILPRDDSDLSSEMLRAREIGIVFHLKMSFVSIWMPQDYFNIVRFQSNRTDTRAHYINSLSVPSPFEIEIESSSNNISHRTQQMTRYNFDSRFHFKISIEFMLDSLKISSIIPYLKSNNTDIFSLCPLTLSSFSPCPQVFQ